MNSILITGGELPDIKNIKKYLVADYICLADSGFDWALENNLDFNVVVGDMDSVKHINELKKLSSNKIIKLPKDKDDTDTIFALKHLRSKGAKHITLIGGGGGRLDHLLGVYSIFESDLAPNIWITKNELIYCVKGYFCLKDFYNTNISVFPINKVVCSINSNGLKWDLNRVNWINKSIGISNYVINRDAWIDSKDNKILIIIPLIGKGFE